MFKRGGHGGLRHLVLQLLSSRPRTGMEVIDAITDITAGFWRPSPGSVYPTLKKLVSEGLLECYEEGGRTLYKLSEAGRREIEERMGMMAPPFLRMSRDLGLDSTLEEIEAYVDYLEDQARMGVKLEGEVKERLRRVALRLEEIAK